MSQRQHRQRRVVTLKEASVRAAFICRIGDDAPEASHGMEDDLYLDILYTISVWACSPLEATELSKLAMRLDKFELTRWYS